MAQIKENATQWRLSIRIDWCLWNDWWTINMWTHTDQLKSIKYTDIFRPSVIHDQIEYRYSVDLVYFGLSCCILPRIIHEKTERSEGEENDALRENALLILFLDLVKEVYVCSERVELESIFRQEMTNDSNLIIVNERKGRKTGENEAHRCTYVTCVNTIVNLVALWPFLSMTYTSRSNAHVMWLITRSLSSIIVHRLWYPSQPSRIHSRSLLFSNSGGCRSNCYQAWRDCLFRLFLSLDDHLVRHVIISLIRSTISYYLDTSKCLADLIQVVLISLINR